MNVLFEKKPWYVYTDCSHWQNCFESHLGQHRTLISGGKEHYTLTPQRWTEQTACHGTSKLISLEQHFLCFCHSMVHWFCCNLEWDSTVTGFNSYLAAWVSSTLYEWINNPYLLLLQHSGVSWHELMYFLGLARLHCLGNAEVIHCFDD